MKINYMIMYKIEGINEMNRQINYMIMYKIEVIHEMNRQINYIIMYKIEGIRYFTKGLAKDFIVTFEMHLIKNSMYDIRFLL